MRPSGYNTGPVVNGRRRLWSPTIHRRQEQEEIIPGLDARFGSARDMVIMFIGPRGTGKSALMTAALARQLRAYVEKGYAGHLFSNYPVSFFREGIDRFSPYLMEEIAMFPKNMRNGIMAVDEIHNDMSNRRAMSTRNVVNSFFLTQIRHRHIECVFTTQFPQVLDPHALLQTNLFIRVKLVSRYPSGFPKKLLLSIIDYWGIFTGKDHRKIWPPQPQDVDAVRPLYLQEWLAGTYDTDYIISNSYMGKDQRDRLIVEEGERAGLDREWLEEMKPPVMEAQAIRTAMIADGQGAMTLESLVEDLPKDGRQIPLTPFIKAAARISNGRIATGPALCKWINEQNGEYHAWVHTAPNGVPIYMVKYRPTGEVQS